jgi:cell division protein FtsQ
MTTYAPAPRVRRPVPVDPRIRARRVDVVRAEGRRRLHRMLFVLGLGVVAAAGAGLVYSPLLDVNQIAVSGASGAQAAAIRNAAGVDRGDPLLLLDLSKVRAGVEALPFVAHANVERELPGTLRIEVVWREPVAWIQNEDGTVDLVDGRGATVISAVSAPAGLPRLGATSASTKPLARIAASLTASLRTRTAGISVDGNEARLDLVGGIVVRLGEPHELAAKVRAVAAVLGTLGGRTVGYIDVRVPDAPVTG